MACLAAVAADDRLHAFGPFQPGWRISLVTFTLPSLTTDAGLVRRLHFVCVFKDF